MNKTIANQANVDKFINGLGEATQRDDSRKLLEIYRRVSGEQPVMWGTTLIGFGTISLTYASGRQVDWFRIGFSPRKGKISLYVTFDAAKLTQQFSEFGKYKIGKGCIYINKLADVNLGLLEKLLESAWQTGYEQPDRKDGKEQAVSVKQK